MKSVPRKLNKPAHVKECATLFVSELPYWPSAADKLAKARLMAPGYLVSVECLLLKAINLKSAGWTSNRRKRFGEVYQKIWRVEKLDRLDQLSLILQLVVLQEQKQLKSS